MAHHKSALKRIKQASRRRLYNRAYKKEMKLAVRSVREAKTYDVALENFKKATSILDKVSSKGIIHKNNASNKKSKLYKVVAALKVN